MNCVSVYGETSDNEFLGCIKARGPFTGIPAVFPDRMSLFDYRLRGFRDGEKK